jgi:hypothetical protein
MKKLLKTRVETFRFYIRSWLGKSPFFLWAVVGCLRGQSKRVCNKKTRVVIEGFPRSANTHCVAYFMHAGIHPDFIASHQHAAAQFFLARKYAKPAILIIRAPQDAILSLRIRRPDVDTDALVREYCAFHRLAYSLKEAVLIARFETVVDHITDVISKLNKKFDTDFPVREMIDENKAAMDAIIDAMDEDDRKSHKGKFHATKESHVSKPIAERNNNPMRDIYKTEIMESPYYPEAMEVYQKMLQSADV